MLGMTVRRLRNYQRDAQKIRASRDRRALHVQRTAQHATADQFEEFDQALAREVDPDYGVHILTLEEFAKGGR